ncbi:MAG TPA: MFS transporter [Chloroflexota bacterium]|nr:MFS transporter [Chloroflexota bacterium]
MLLLMVVFASAAASPLYRVYQVQFGFSAITLTAVFAVYVLTLLLTLLFFGSVSDHLGRRPVIFAATGFSIAACVVFLAVGSVPALFAARCLQGIATGLASGSIGAALFDLQPAGSQRASLATSAFSTLGLALGALISSALIQYAPAPTQLIWWALLAVFIAGIGAVMAIAEPGSRRPGVFGSMRPKVAVPQQARATFVGAIPCLVGVWAMGGLYLSLGPSLAALAVGSSNRVWGGLVIFLLFGTGAAVSLTFRGIPSRAATIRGSMFLLAGLALTFFAIATTTSAAFLIGTAVAGVGFGLAFLGTFRMTTAQATPGRSAELVTAVFVVAYLAFSVPALIAGVGTTSFGLQSTALGYCAALAVLIAAAAGALLVRAQEPAQPAWSSPEILPPGPCTCPPCPRAFEEVIRESQHVQAGPIVTGAR